MKRIARVFALILALSFVLMTMTGCVVWREERAGRAALARANYQAQVLEVEARNRMLAETYNAEAEIIRAHGIAEAMYIVSKDITIEYLIHFWIRTMETHTNRVYIPIGNDGFPMIFDALTNGSGIGR